MAHELNAPRLVRATIEFDVDAEDYLSAAQFQESFDRHVAAIRADFPQAQVVVRERRARAYTVATQRRIRIKSGRVHAYEG